MKKLLLLLFTFIFIINHSSFAQQKGYVIYSNHDTVACFKVKNLKTRNNEIKYKENDDNADFETGNAGMILGYKLSGSNGVIYRSMLTDSNQSPVFMQVIEDGKIRLYEEIVFNGYTATVGYGGMTGSFSTKWYVSKNNQPLVLIDIVFHRKQCKEILSEMFKDNPRIYSDFETGDDFSKRVLSGYIKHYNQAAATQQ